MSNNQIPCYHCGDSCPENPIKSDDKSFCCSGCKTVYELLSEHNLGNFYDLEDRPGIKPESQVQGKYNFLLSEEIAAKLYDFDEGNMKRIRIFLPDVHCSSCIYLLENLHKINNGIISSEVNFVRKVASIYFDSDRISLNELAKLLDKIGYPPKFDSQSESDNRNKRNRSFLLKLGITFFCFSNIMLFSFPEYLNFDESFEQSFRGVFAYLVFAFSIPLILYSSSDYLISAYKAIRNKTVNLDVPISLGILVLYIKSAIDIFSGHGPGYMDSFAGFILFLLIGKWFQNKTYQALSFERDYLSYFPMAVTVLINNREEIVPIQDLTIGSVIRIRNNEIIPVDVILNSSETNIDYSFVTGESRNIRKIKGDKIFAGGRQIGSTVELTILKKVENSYLTQLWNNSENDSSHKESGLVKITENISKYFIISVIIIAAITGLVWLNIDPSKSLSVITAVLIVACPCALALSIPFTYGNSIRIASRNQWYFKNSETIEQLGSITDIVFDKTGTITESRNSMIEYHGSKTIDQIGPLVLSLARLSNHPLSKTLSDYLSKRYDYKDAQEFIEEEGFGLSAVLGEQRIKIGNASWTDSEISKESGSAVYVSINDQSQGYFLILNKYRPSVIDLIEKLGLSYNLHLLSGDNDSEKSNLEKVFVNKGQILFNQQPHDKLQYVKNLRSEGKRVMMVGDGLNDAGALNESHVGIAVNEGVYNFSPACDAIVKADKLQFLPSILDLGQYSLKVLKLTYVFSLLYNLIGLYFAVSGILTPLIAAILMPLSSISVVFLATITMRIFESHNFKN